MASSDEQRLREAREVWDLVAATFDDQPDHGLLDPIVRGAWADLLARWVPPARAPILDVGCGTGSLSVLLSELGHDVTGIDASPAMIAQAQKKAYSAGQRVTFTVMDAADPQLASQHFDVILCRHLLWALPEPAAVLGRWAKLLAPEGRLVLIEGFWHTGAGLHARQVVDALPPSLMSISVQDLSDQLELWGGEVHDERYAVIASTPYAHHPLRQETR